MNRRSFWHRAGLPLLFPTLTALRAQADPAASFATEPSADRATWLRYMQRTAQPVIAALAENRLIRDMPVQQREGQNRRPFTHLEAFGRTLSGIAPWLACRGLTGEEESHRATMAEQTRQALKNIVTPGAPDQLSFTAGSQCLVDAAFLALGLLRAPDALWHPLDAATRQALTDALISTRRYTPGKSNWLLFSAMVEAFLASTGGPWQQAPIQTALVSHEDWYLGDGTYGDGPSLHWDYYNSFVIQPMILAVHDALSSVDRQWDHLKAPAMERARRYAVVQERLVAPDGSFPATGRSLTYRCGAFHLLADIALRRQLPENPSPAQTRCALAAVIHRTLGAPGTTDAAGWLRAGLAGDQPSVAEPYISTGSLYLCCTAFLPLGLPPDDPFWSSPPVPWTSCRIWSGADMPADHAMKDPAH